MTSDTILSRDDPQMQPLIDKARELVAMATEVAPSHSIPGTEHLQAFHFASAALLNASGLTEDETAECLAALVGLVVADRQDGEAFSTILRIGSRMVEYLHEGHRRRGLLAPPMGRA